MANSAEKIDRFANLQTKIFSRAGSYRHIPLLQSHYMLPLSGGHPTHRAPFVPYGQGKGLTVGKKLYFELVDRGYKTIELPSSVMSQYVLHLAHATQVINPQEFTLRKRTVTKCHRLMNKVMLSTEVQNILADDILDE